MKPCMIKNYKSAAKTVRDGDESRLCRQIKPYKYTSIRQTSSQTVPNNNINRTSGFFSNKKKLSNSLELTFNSRDSIEIF